MPKPVDNDYDAKNNDNAKAWLHILSWTLGQISQKNTPYIVTILVKKSTIIHNYAI